MNAAARRGQPLLKHRTPIAGLALLCAAGCSQALTLGSVRGGALLGQALNVVVPVQLDAGEDAATLCFDAEVFHAETRQPASRVRVRVEALPQAPRAEVRIVSSAAVDEPVVTIELRAGCGQQTTRRYVLLADMPSPIAAPASSLPLLAPATTAPTVTLPATVRPAPAETSAGVNPKPMRSRQRPTPKATPAPAKDARAVEPSQAAQAAGRARLKLDPLEFFSDRIANLAAPAPLTLPQDALRTMQRMQTLEGSVKSLTASAALNEASLADLKARLQKAERAESERFPGVLVYGLSALLLACLAALAWLWQRQRGRPSHEDPWWSDSVNLPAAAPPDLATPLQATPDTASSTAARPETAPASVLDIDLVDLSDSSFAAFLPSEEAEPEPVSTAAPSAPSPVPATPARHLNIKTLRDIRQQAEFFVSLGQADQAVQILKQHLGDAASPNPFVCLDLLGLLHSLDQKIEFQQLRDTFNQTFSGQVPEFELFTDQGQGLETYPDLLARICELWPTPQVLALMDDCIFADPARDEALSLDLAALRDLLLLHVVARHLISGTELDLDLSDSTMANAAVTSASLPDASGNGSPAPFDGGNLIEFDLPEIAPPPAPSGDEPGPPSNRR
jgi:pilus assembly protein FimV